jgi:NAD-dependent DNA ligase
MMNKPEIDALVERIQKCNTAYRMGQPEISDAEYDKLVEHLREIAPEHEWLKTLEPAPVSSKRKVKLPIPMKSLNKVKSFDGVLSWLKSLALNSNTKLVVMPKFDGISLLHDEVSNKAYSRGGSENEGQDCTSHFNVWQPEFKPVTDSPAFTFGEFVFCRATWNNLFEGKISPETDKPYVSPRNTVAGFINRDLPSPLLQHIDFHRYGIDDISRENYTTYYALYKSLCKMYNQPALCLETTAKELSGSLLHELYATWQKAYYIDGLVIYINDLNMWDVIGRHQTTGNPMYAIAYKHPSFTEVFETTVLDVTWNIAKSGAFKPVVNIETVNVGDCLINQPTGYNAGWIKVHKIAPGAIVKITRSGGVIPKIMEIVRTASEESIIKMWNDLSTCPICGGKTRWSDSQVELICTNPDCDGVQLAKLIFFFETCGVDGLGDETFNKLYQNGFKTVKDLLEASYQKLLSCDNLGPAIVEIIIQNALRIKDGVDMPTMMQASDCFSGIGKIKAQKLLDSLSEDDLQKFYNLDFHPNTESVDLQSLPKTTQSFYSGLDKFYKFITRNNLKILKPEPKAEVNADGPLKGEAICFSGFRDFELEAAIILNGGTIVSGVSKKTTMLIVKDINSSSSKITKAQNLGVKIIPVSDFYKSLT